MNGCFGIARQDFYVKEKVVKGKSIKVVHANPNDILQGNIEQALIKEGWNLIGHHVIFNQIPAPLPSVVMEMDTIHTAAIHNYVAQPLFEERRADYILRYQYRTGASQDRLWRFNAKIVDIRSGEIINSYTFRNIGTNATPINKVLDRMIQDLGLTN